MLQPHEPPPESVKYAANGGNALKQLQQSLQRDLARSKKSGRHEEYRQIFNDLDDLEEME